ncbi:DUF4825 domain-containing protein [Rossellomorea marisflavi]|uniref:DUF4825 domain-containing protein n=2 Tax=Rossellomorea marisflavi TaxID=189381 RepID=A0A5D4RTM7_9BACI|nr:DUF4825 domain-containing protein [Rossellomorea marisflavi]
MIMKSKITLIVFIAVLLMGACSQVKPEEKITTIEHTNLKELKAYSGTYVGDNSDVSAIVRLLPGGETMGEIDLTGEKLHVTYDDGAKSISESAFQTFWFNGNRLDRKKLYFNALYLALLVPNAKEYRFTVADEELAIPREQITAALSKEFKRFPQGDAQWDEKTVSTFIDDHKGKLTEMATNYHTYFEE